MELNKFLIIATDAKSILQQLFGDGTQNQIKSAVQIFSGLMLVVSIALFLLYIIQEGMAAWQSQGGFGKETFAQFWDKVKTGALIFVIVIAICTFGLTWS